MWVFEPPPFDPNRPTLVAPVRADPSGLRGPTRKEARGPRWRRTSRGFFVPADLPEDDPQQRTVEASVLLRPGEAVTGWAALHWLGGRWFGSSADPVPLVTQREVVPPPGVLVSQEHLKRGEVVVVDGLPVTTPVRSVCFAMRHARDWRDGVVAIDMACYSDLVTVAEVAAYAARIGPWTGIPRCRKALAYADENSWSPQEVIMRLVWTIDAGYPRPLCNVPVFDRHGRHVGTPDLLDPVAGVVGEYDGSQHLLGPQRGRDVRREGEFRRLGLEWVTMVASDRADDYVSFRSRLTTAYANARHAPADDRPWATDPPSWWVDTSTVAARARLHPAARARLLRHRRAA